MVTVHNNMWCDLGKPITWCKISNLTYWYHMKVWNIIFSELLTWALCDTGIVTEFKGCQKQRKTLEICCKFALFCSFTMCNKWQVFSDHITYNIFRHDKYKFYLAVCEVSTQLKLWIWEDDRWHRTWMIKQQTQTYFIIQILLDPSFFSWTIYGIEN